MPETAMHEAESITFIDQSEKDDDIYGNINYSSNEQSNDERIDEDTECHEEQFNRKLYLRKKMDEYISRFTLHGLTKACNGGYECILWVMILFGGILLTVMVVYGRFVKYLKFGVYTEIQSKVTDENYFPTVTFCEYDMYAKKHNSYCGIPTHLFENKRNITTKHCDHEKHTRDSDSGKRQILYEPNRYWSNGFFNITGCLTWDLKNCLSSGYFKPMEYFDDACIRFNYAGNLSDLYTHVDIEFEFNTPPGQNGEEESIIAIPHDHKIYQLDLTKRIPIESEKLYEIKLYKTEIKRLPAPYPSRCTDDKKNDIFPGIYSRHSCMSSHIFIKDYMACGDTLDYARQYILDETKTQFKQNKTISETIKCIKQARKTEINLKDLCAFPCTELELNSIPFVKPVHRKKGPSGHVHASYHVGIQYQHVDAYSVMEEKEIYSWDRLACEIGGLIGLVIGASILSIVEILVYAFLFIARKFV